MFYRKVVYISSKPGVEAIRSRAERETQSWRSRLRREPLVHFLAIGAVLFALAGFFGRTPAKGSRRIEITQDQLHQMKIGFASQWNRPPASEELADLVEGRIREEILYREALALGLDKDDEIVKRRMVQKMEFLTDDRASSRQPGANELRAWFSKNSQRFATAPKVTFHHIYFSSDVRGAGAQEDAMRAEHTLSGRPGDTPSAGILGDPFMFRSYYASHTAEQLGKEFGPGFAKSVFALRPNAWQGPVESGFGWHVIWIDSIEPSRIPEFKQVEDDVKTEWLAEQRSEARRISLEKMRARYQVVIARPSAESR